jgi:hypothetical protein
MGSILLLAVSLAALNNGGAGGCGGGAGGESGGGSEDAVADTAATVVTGMEATGAALAAIGQSLGSLTLSALAINTGLDCSTGSAPITGETTVELNFTWNVNVNFDDCDGVNGTLDVSGTGQFLGFEEGVTWDAPSYGGTLTANGCAVSFDDLTATGTAAVSTALTSCFVTGTATADCTENGETVSVGCTWDSVDCSDEPGFEAGCGLM